MTLWAALPPFERMLLQICSIFYEPVDTPLMASCLVRSGYPLGALNDDPFPQVSEGLTRLQDLKLLHAAGYCHETIVETVTRSTLPGFETCLLERDEVLHWVSGSCPAQPAGGARCDGCRGTLEPEAFLVGPRALCPVCLEIELRKLSDREDFASWTPEAFLDSLMPESALYGRLTVLWRFQEVWARISSLDQTFRKELLSRLVRTLQDQTPTALPSTVQAAAVLAILSCGEAALPALIPVTQEKGGMAHAGAMQAAAMLAPKSSRLRAMLLKAVQGSSMVARNCAASIPGDATGHALHSLQGRAAGEGAAPPAHMEEGPWKLLCRFPPASSVSPMLKGLSHLGKFGRIAQVVLQEVPLKPFLYFQNRKNLCRRMVRDFRISVQAGNLQEWVHKKQAIASVCSSLPAAVTSVQAVFDNPFQESWMVRLPLEIQQEALALILEDSILRLKPAPEALAYAARDDFLQKSLESENWPLLHLVAGRFLLAGRVSEARSILARMEHTPQVSGLKGWMLFIEGKHEDAVAVFKEDLRRLKKLKGRRATALLPLTTVFRVLGLVTTRDTGLKRQIESEVSRLLGDPASNALFSSIGRSLRSILHTVFFEPVPSSEAVPSGLLGDSPDLAAFFHLLASYWFDGTLGDEEIDLLSRVFIQSKKGEFGWVARQCAEMLCETEGSTPLRAGFMETFDRDSGAGSILSLISVEEPWAKSLKALQAMEFTGRGAQEEDCQKRLIWLLEYREDGRVQLHAVEQTAAGGTWSRGRRVSLKRLSTGQGLEYLGPQDHRLRACVRRRTEMYSEEAHELDVSRALPALVGHPLVFLKDAPHVPVEVVEGVPDLSVRKTPRGFHVAFRTTVARGGAVLVRETPTRFKVVRISDEHFRIAEILGPGGLHVPREGLEDLLGAMRKVSKIVTVHSDIAGPAGELLQVEADATPHLHLLPHGEGLRMELFVRPLKGEGPLLRPGEGAENLMAEVGGRTVQTRRDLEKERRQAAALEISCPALKGFEAGRWEWLVMGPDDCLQALLDLGSLRDEGRLILSWPEGERLRVTPMISFNNLRMGIRKRSNWFELSGELFVDHQRVLQLKQLLDLVRSTESRFIPLGNGEFLALTGEFKRRLEELATYADAQGKEVRLHPLAVGAVQELAVQLRDLDADEAWHAQVERLGRCEEISPPVPAGLKAELRDYQVEGFRWLARLANLGVGACLADDMGLGKTLQALSLLLHRAPEGPSLVVAPTSVCLNWLEEAGRFAPSLRAQVLGGGDREDRVRSLAPHDVLICSYGLLQQEAKLVASIRWNTIVLDEAQAIKNMTTKRSQAAMKLKGAFKLITTGTPIENHLGELWNLFHFINPGLLGSADSFSQRFAVPIEKHGDPAVGKRLKKLIRPFILRRTKSQVLHELPPRTEVLLRVEMYPEEAAFYEALRRQALERLESDNGDSGRRHIKILSEILRLRQACCHPRLVVKDSPIPSSKLDLFGEVIREIRENGHKALIFSQFVAHLALLRQYLDGMGVPYRYLDGGTAPKDRKREVDAFQAGHGDLFLISLKAGGLGLNLTAADFVIHMDPWWNPSVEDQASDRAHRIGQEHPVTIYRLVSKGTIEEKIVRLHESKKELADTLLEGTDVTGKISAEELLRLIRDQ